MFQGQGRRNYPSGLVSDWLKICSTEVILLHVWVEHSWVLGVVYGGNVSRDALWGMGVKRQHQEQEARGHLCEMGLRLLEAGAQTGEAERIRWCEPECA